MSQYYGNGYNSGGLLSRLFGNIPPATRNLFLICALMFIATIIKERFMVGTFAVFYPASPYFRIWQPVSYMFMHGGWMHIFVNMWALLMFGSALERSIGTKKYLLFFFVTGLGALLIHIAVQYLQIQGLEPGSQAYWNILRTPTLGASGALYGIQIGYAMLYPNAVWTLIFPPIPLKAKWFVLIFIGIELFTGITGTMDGVAHFAHLGGALFGFLMILFWKKRGTLWNDRF